MLDLHYTRTIVLNVEVENWKSHRKENPCTTTPRHSALSSGVFSSSRGRCFFLSTKVECPWGRRAHVFLMWLSPCEGHLCDPHLPQMLFRCHDEAYSPLPPPHTQPPPTSHLRKTSCQSRSAGRGRWNQPARKAEPHFNTPIIFLFFCLFCHCESCSETTLYLFFSSLFRRSGGIDCARIFACSRDWGRQCPVLTEDSRGHYRKSLKAWVCAKGLTKLEGSFQTYQALCVCVHVCSYLETDGLPADWDSKRGLAGDDNTRPGRRGFFLGRGEGEGLKC